MSTLAPERSLAQRLDALDRANEIRTTRARLKKDIKAGEYTVTDLLRDPPPVLDTMKVLTLLLAAPKVGQVKANKMLAQCRISPTRTVGGLSLRQRKDLDRLLSR